MGITEYRMVMSGMNPVAASRSVIFRNSKQQEVIRKWTSTRYSDCSFS